MCPVIELSGYRTSGSQLTVRISNAQLYLGIRKPDVYVRLSDVRARTGRSKSGQICPDFGRSGNWRRLNRSLVPVLVRTGTKTGSKPVWNRFWYRFGTGSEPVLVWNVWNVWKPDVISGFQTLYPVSDVWKPDITSGFRTSGSLNSNSRNLYVWNPD